MRLDHTFDDGTEVSVQAHPQKDLPTLGTSFEHPKPESRERRPNKGEVKMTPWKRGKGVVVYKNAEVQRPLVLRDHRSYSTWWWTHRCADGEPTAVASPSGAPFISGNTRQFSGLPAQGGIYTHWGYLELADKFRIYTDSLNWDTISSRYDYDSDRVKPLTDDELHALRQKAMRELVLDIHSTYDVLTDLAEAREVIELILSLLRSIRNPLKAARDAYLRARRAPHTEAASLWLQYRYAIMPIIYSARDINELLNGEKATGVNTKHRTLRKSYAANSEPRKPGDFLYEKGTYDVTVRATAAWPATSNLFDVFNQLEINPAVTAWELVPFSFVLDWFIGVGDWLKVQTFNLQNHTDVQFCVATRIRAETETYLRIAKWQEKEMSIEKHFNEWSASRTPCKSGTSWNHEFSMSGSWESREIPQQDLLVRTTVIDSYERDLFTPADVGLELNISPDALNWKRWLDAISLAVGNLKLRSLRI